MIVLLLLAGVSLDVEVARLADPDPGRRLQARIALVAAGDDGVPLLFRTLRSTDVEARRQACAVLDELFTRSLAGPRRYEDYRVPDNQMTQQLRSIRGVQPQLLAHDAFFDAVKHHYYGSLKKWDDPTLVDYHLLLRSFAERVRVASAATPSRDENVLETLLAAHAIVWRLRQLAPGLGAGHWTTRWMLQREVVPALQLALSGRGITKAEYRLLEPVIAHARPLVAREPEGSPLRTSFTSVDERLRALRPR